MYLQYLTPEEERVAKFGTAAKRAGVPTKSTTSVGGEVKG